MFTNVCCYNRCNGNAFTGFRPYGITFMNVCFITVAMVMLLRDFGPNWDNIHDYVCLLF
jgi:hypothetical protein